MKSIVRGFLFAVFLIFPAIDSDSRITPEIYNQTEEVTGTKSSWTLFNSPTRNKLNKIIMLSPSKGFIAGRFLSIYDGESWKLFEPQPHPQRITDIFATGENNLWVTFNTNSSESELYHFNGKDWKKVNHPFANTINTMTLSENNVEWIGGDREIAHRNGGSWEYLPYPDNFGYVNYIYPVAENKVWVNTSQNKLYFYDGKKWNQVLNDEPVRLTYFENPAHAYFLSSDKLLEYDGKKIFIHSQNKLLKDFTKLSFLKNDEIWAIGMNGLVAHYNMGSWEKVIVPTVEDLTDIQMLTPDEGWIIGDNGTILHYSFNKQTNNTNNHVGFNPIKIISVSKDLNDEYGVAIDDLNNDGLKDVYTVCIFEPNRLYINKSVTDSSGRVQSLRFNEEASLRGVTGVTGDTNSVNFRELDLGVGLADVDNDGDLDIYLCNLLGPNKLLLNNGKGYFRNVSNESNRGTGKNERTNVAIWGDVDNDGDLDLFITNEETTNRLYLNNGNGYFTEITESAGLTTKSGGMGAAFGDIDGDGKLDLYVANWAAPNILYKNISSKEAGVKFVNITEKAGVGGEPFSKSNGVAFADIDNDGDLDLFVTNRKRSNRLYLNDGKGNFHDITESAIGIDSMLSYGATFGDFDQDGFQDLYVANVGDNVLYKNINGKKFIPVTAEFGTQMNGYNTGSACGDIDNDGDLDLYVANYIDGNSVLYINNVNNANFIKFKVEGTISNRDAVGTKVWLYKGGHANEKKYLLGYREISGGSGYGSYNAREVHFGLNEPGNYDVVIFFPASGIKKILKNIPSGKLYYVTEEEGFKASIILFSKWSSRFISDPDTNRESAKFIVVLILLAISIYRGNKRCKWNAAHQIIFHGSLIIIYWALIILFLYKGFLLSDVFPVFSIIIVLAILHLLYERVILARINKLEKQATRDRIARDLHDDLASTLSSSVIYNEALRRSLKNIPDEDKSLLERINKLLLEASEAVTDIVWTVSPTHDKLDDLILRLRRLISDCCKSNGIEHIFQIEIDKHGVIVPEEMKRNIYLIFKEALNNIVKHAAANELTFSARLKDGLLELKLEDNGKGFIQEEFLIDEAGGIVLTEANAGALHGNGLMNMIHRSKEINAQFTIESKPGSGTKIILTIKMT
ncbi:MAG: FG-GAP-like repeat-containing protein [Ignavibacteriaceae bacterium]